MINEHGIQHRRGLTCPIVTPIPDLRPGLDSPTSSASAKPPFQGSYEIITKIRLKITITKISFMQMPISMPYV